MGKIMVEIVEEQITHITRTDLWESYKSVEKDLKDSYKDFYIPSYDYDVKEDRKRLRKLLKSFKDVLEYYGLDVDNEQE